MATQVILLEKIEKLGSMGDVVNVKPGYARNYLLPQSKALRATKDNIAYFEAQKATLEKANEEKKKEAEKLAKKIEGLKVAIVRQASEGGQLYGSVTSRDISEAVAEQSKEAIVRSMVTLNQNFKTIGLFPVDVVLHPEVKVEVTVNIARSMDEAEIQAKTGKALISDDSQDEAEKAKPEEADAREDLMETEALEAEKAREAEEAEKAAEDAAKAEEKSAARAEKKAATKAAEDAEAEEGEAETAEAAPAENAEGDEKAE